MTTVPPTGENVPGQAPMKIAGPNQGPGVNPQVVGDADADIVADSPPAGFFTRMGRGLLRIVGLLDE